MAIKESSIKVIEYLQNKGDVQVTSQDVADALGLTKKQVDGIFTSAIQRKGYGVRIPGEITLEDGNHKAVKYLEMTEEGLAFDPHKSDE